MSTDAQACALPAPAPAPGAGEGAPDGAGGAEARAGDIVDALLGLPADAQAVHDVAGGEPVERRDGQAHRVPGLAGGQPVAPALTALAGESLQFTRVIDQTHRGTTADGEWLALQSLHPLAMAGVERGTYHIGVFRAMSVLRTARLLAITSGTTVRVRVLSVSLLSD